MFRAGKRAVTMTRAPRLDVRVRYIAIRVRGTKGLMVCEDPSSQDLQALIARIAPSDVPVLITGETGTGKEVTARQVHAASRRASGPFVAVNAGAFSETLIESELFGHERGAFTGAHTSKQGWFEAAQGGTLFLDEIGELPLPLQVKLLRVLQEREVTPIGARRPIPIDVRVIAATNVDLREAIRQKRFREDLFYRLNVTSLQLPALRDRPADILPLTQHFIERYESEPCRVRLSPSAAQRLMTYRWPGNVRELENAVRHALLVRRSDELGASDFPLASESLASESFASESFALRTSGANIELGALESALAGLFEQGVPDLQAKVEATLLTSAYRFCGRNQLETARMLGMSRHVVRAKLIEHGVLEGFVRRNGVHARGRALVRGKAPEVLRIGYQKLGLLMLVKGCGALDAALAARGVKVEWAEYAGGIQLVEALRTERLSAAVLGDCPAVFAQAQDVPIVYLAAEPPAPRGTALVVPERSPLRQVSDLRGKRVAVNRAAQAHYLLLRALEEAGVAADEVEIRFAPPDRALVAFETGEIDAWAIWDPWLSSARLDLRARVLRDSTGLMKNAAYHVARRDFAERRPDLIDELLRHLRLAAEWVKTDPERVGALLAPSLGLSSRALVASLERELTAVPVSAELIAAQQVIADTLLRLQMIERPVTVADAQWSLAAS
jgi:aliphatic sulfonates family ABC transporter substrate-binding protein